MEALFKKIHVKYSQKLRFKKELSILEIDKDKKKLSFKNIKGKYSNKDNKKNFNNKDLKNNENKGFSKLGLRPKKNLDWKKFRYNGNIGNSLRRKINSKKNKIN